ncbi:hypothetical protein BpHYR1_040230 [Brachionus plicatilis]|uniref:Uncharacterized protein n=1 Tax=Brachionus plicatilis TaxID=10195 RepID=A0A3M7S1X0_BRAPC|nr:hypothetical protein BpHYR1_040230 [Brachionus plicatilis]
MIVLILKFHLKIQFAIKLWEMSMPKIAFQESKVICEQLFTKKCDDEYRIIIVQYNIKLTFTFPFLDSSSTIPVGKRKVEQQNAYKSIE